MSLIGILKLTGWLAILRVLLHVQVFAVGPRFEVAQETQEYINALYANPFISNLIKDYPQQYLRVVFRHFRADFVRNDIGNWRNSHWPILLQDLKLMPTRYCTRNSQQDAEPLRNFWLQERNSLEAQPIPNYRHTAVRVPDIMANVFHQNTAHYHFDLIRYDHLVEEMQRFAEQYDVLSTYRTRTLWYTNAGKRVRFLAMYWLTVLDQFIDEVQRVAGAGAILASPSPRTHLMPLDPQRAPSPRGPPPAYPPGPRAPAYLPQHNPRVRPMTQQMAHPLAQPGPSGSIPVRRAPSPNRGTKRKATNQGGGPSFQGGGKRGPGGAMRSMDGASNEPQVGQVPQVQQSKSRGSCTALSWISIIMVTIAVSFISFA